MEQDAPEPLSFANGEPKLEVEAAKAAPKPQSTAQSESIPETERLLREFRDAVEALKTPPQLNIQADRFVLVDKDGRRRAELTMAADGTPGLVLYDENGVRRGGFNLSAAGAPSIVLHDKHGKPRAEVALKPDGVVGLGFYDERGEGRAELSIAGDGAAALSLFGTRGERIAQLPVRNSKPE